MRKLLSAQKTPSIRKVRAISWLAVTVLMSTVVVGASRTDVSATFFPWPTNPSLINGLRLWLDASDIDGDGNYSTNPADGSVVTEWKDKSGNANDAKVIPGKSAGAYIGNSNDGINGQPTIRFTRVNDVMGTVFRVSGVDIRAVSSPKVTIFSVYRPRNIAANNGVWGADNGGWDRFFLSYHPNFGNGITDGIASLGPNQRQAVVPNAGVSGSVRLLTVVYNGNVVDGVNQGPSNGSAVYFNGDLVRQFTDSTHASNAQSTFAIGWDGDNSVFDGDIAEVLIYGRVLSSSEIRDVNHYFSEKYSFQVASPNTVPGKPMNLSAVCDESSATITFTPGSSGGDAISNYEHSFDGGRTWTAFNPAVSTGPLVIPGIASGVVHRIVIRAVNNIGAGEPSSAVSCSHQAPAPLVVEQPTTPDAPTDLIAREGFEKHKVIFNEGFDGGSPITHYEYTINDSNWQEFLPGETSSPVIFRNLDPERRHRIRLRAVNAIGPGTASDSVVIARKKTAQTEVTELSTLPETGMSQQGILFASMFIFSGWVLVYVRRRFLHVSSHG